MPPAIGARIDDQARPVHVVGLRARRRDRAPPGRRPGDSDSARRRRTRASASNQPSADARHRQRRLALDLDRDRRLRRRPQAKARAVVARAGSRRTAGSRAKPLMSRLRVEAERQHDAARRDHDLLAVEVALGRVGLRRCRAAAAPAGRGGGRRKAAILARVGIEEAVRIDTVPSPLRPARRSTSVRSSGLFQASLRDRSRPCASNQAMSRMPGAGSSLAVQEARRSAAPRGGGASAMSRAAKSVQRAALGAVGLRPVEPGDLVVLAIGVVVAALGAAELVAGQQHRRALRQEHAWRACARCTRRRGVAGSPDRRSAPRRPSWPSSSRPWPSLLSSPLASLWRSA